jgi:hypothetical protein
VTRLLLPALLFPDSLERVQSTLLRRSKKQAITSIIANQGNFKPFFQKGPTGRITTAQKTSRNVWPIEIQAVIHFWSYSIIALKILFEHLQKLIWWVATRPKVFEVSQFEQSLFDQLTPTPFFLIKLFIYFFSKFCIRSTNERCQSFAFRFK